jgi:uncharacterized membrane protein
MTDIPVQLIVAAFNSPDGAGQVMADLKQGKKAGLIGILDAAVVVKDANGKLKITDSRRHGRRGMITGGVIGGVLGLLAGPVGLLAVGGTALGALAGRVAGSPMKATMQEIGEALTPGTSAIVATIEHTWVAQLEAALVAEGARVVRESIKADIAEQLSAGGNVLYTVGGGATALGAARVAETQDGIQVSGIAASDQGVFVGDALLTDEQPVEDVAGEGTESQSA